MGKKVLSDTLKKAPKALARPGLGVVLQVNDMGCGVACISAILGISYARGLALFADLPGDDVRRGFSRRALQTVLMRAGLQYRFRPARSPMIGRIGEASRLPVGTIVFVRDEVYPRGHYLARRRNGWMDPLRPTLRTRLVSVPRSYLVPVIK
jgi:hypothetical protein